ncbi:MAG: methylamine utilization protein [Elusimicrobia bacterium]|nr:methylamine utilization protein [Elusimicrobiota bacterium]
MKASARIAAASACLLGASIAAAADLTVSVRDLGGAPIEDAVVFVYEASGKFAPPKEPAVMDQIDKTFVPRVLAILAGTKVRFPNKDDIHHHVYSFSKARKFDLPLYKGEPTDPIAFETPGLAKLGCNIHDWMMGYVLILENPYFAKTAKDGTAHLKNVPAGTYKLALWSDRRKEPVEQALKTVSIGKDEKVSFKLAFGPLKLPKPPAVKAYK